MSAIFIMWKRQLIRYWRTRVRMIGALGQPLLFFIALGFGFGPIYAKAGGGDYISFLAPGIMSMTILFTSIFSAMEVIWDKQIGFLKETLIAPVPRWHLMLGKTLGGATIALFQAFIVLLLAIIFGFRPNLLAIPLAFLFMFLVGFLFAALGIVIASNLQDMQGFPIIMNFIIMPIFFISGALFPISSMPKTLAAIAKLNPLSYGVEGIRAILTGTAHISLLTDLAVIIIASLIMLAIGTYFFSKIEA